MRILQDARAPMARRHMRDSQLAMPIAVPPVEFDDFVKAQVGHQIQDVMRHHDDRSVRPAGVRACCTMARNDGRCRWSKCACVTSTRSIGGRSRSRTPGLRRRFNTKSQRAKLGSMTTFCPPICTKKLACPMNVTPSSPLLTSLGLYVWPVRGVTAEWRTRVPNARARLRRAGFRKRWL